MPRYTITRLTQQGAYWVKQRAPGPDDPGADILTPAATDSPTPLIAALSHQRLAVSRNPDRRFRGELTAKTTVLEMGTGVAPPALPPGILLTTGGRFSGQRSEETNEESVVKPHGRSAEPWSLTMLLMFPTLRRR